MLEVCLPVGFDIINLSILSLKLFDTKDFLHTLSKVEDIQNQK